jgi:histidinol phosphatase-like PHP family hydrolase
LLEISGRAGHCLANGHVVQMARRVGAAVIFGSDAHAPEDLRARRDALDQQRGHQQEAQRNRETKVQSGFHASLLSCFN